MQSQSINNFRFIMNYQDHLIKCVILNPFISKHAEKISHNLSDIYTTFRTPVILYSGIMAVNL